MSSDERNVSRQEASAPATRSRQAQNERMLASADVRKRPGVFSRLLRNGKARLGGVLLLVMVLSAIAAPVISPHQPTTQNVMGKLAPPGWQAEGTWEHPLGTDHLGRDVLSRIIHGSRISLFIGFLATLAAGLVGITLGVVAGYFGPYTDAIIMRLADVQLAFPAILLALAVMVVLGTGIQNLIIILAITGWVFFSRIIRGDVLVMKNREFMEAGRAIGATEAHLIRHYVVPNIISTSMVIATLTIARVVISESSLSFLGVGIQPPTASWGAMLSEGRAYLSTGWWITTFSGLALMTTVIGVNLLGDALRDVLDPRLTNSD